MTIVLLYISHSNVHSCGLFKCSVKLYYILQKHHDSDYHTTVTLKLDNGSRQSLNITLTRWRHQVLRRSCFRGLDAVDCRCRQPVVMRPGRLHVVDSLWDNVVIHFSRTSEVQYRGTRWSQLRSGRSIQR